MSEAAIVIHVEEDDTLRRLARLFVRVDRCLKESRAQLRRAEEIDAALRADGDG